MPVGGLPNGGGDLVQRKEGGVGDRHYHHFAAQHAGRNLGASRNIFVRQSIISQTRWSGAKVRRRTGTRATNSQADWNTSLTSSASSAKNNMLRKSEPTASCGSMSSI